MPVAPDKSALDPEIFDVELEPHVLTDKQQTKNVPCGKCRRCCVVTTFMAPAKVKCRTCTGGNTNDRAAGSQAVVQAGRTAPELATNLADCLLNDNFAYALCPKDPSHTVELKDVCHSPNYGPRHLLGYKDGIPKYEQETGELVTHQCLDCATVVQYSTTHPRQLRRVNQAKHSDKDGPGAFEVMLGVRED